MESQAPYAEVNPYAAAQMQQIALQRLQQNAGMSNFPGRPDSFVPENEHANLHLKAEGQWQWDKSAVTVSNPSSTNPYSEENMERQAPYAEVNPYAAARMQQIALQRMQQNAGMSNFQGRPDSFVAEKEHANLPLQAEGQWQRDKNAARMSNPPSTNLYSEGQAGQGGNATQSLYGHQMPDPKVDLEKQTNTESKLQAHEQDMEIGYEDQPSTLNFEGLERRFIDEIVKLAKEQSDAEDAENARHRERMIEVNAHYQEKLSSLRARQAKRREEFLLKEAHSRLHQYQQAGSNHHPANVAPIDPRVYGGEAAAEAQRAFASGQFESFRERSLLQGSGRNQGTVARVPFPEGRVYHNARKY